MKTSQAAGVSLDPTGRTLKIDDLLLDDRAVVDEARRWTTGPRGPVVDDVDVLAGADLSVFVTEAMIIGCHALAVTGQAADVRAVEQAVKDVGEKTADAASRAAGVTERAAREAASTVAKVAADAKNAIAEADRQTRTELTAAVESARTGLLGEMGRLFGGERPELLDRLRPMLDRFGVELDARLRDSAAELLEKTSRQFDPADPASPMARHAAALVQQQGAFATQLEKSYAELAAKVEEVATAMKVREARAAMLDLSPTKGAPYEEALHRLMSSVAVGLGDEYADTRTTIGLVPHSRKGDGVLAVAGGVARVLVEMTDSARSGWNDYLDEAERNRGAVAALGIVRTPEQNAGQAIRVLGPRRIVISFDPEHDDPQLLRTVVLLLRTVALAATARTGTAELATAEERIGEAIAHLEKIDAVKTLAGSIQRNATKIDRDCTTIAVAIARLLNQALAALAGAEDAEGTAA